jgi:hypothetical protein
MQFYNFLSISGRISCPDKANFFKKRDWWKTLDRMMVLKLINVMARNTGQENIKRGLLGVKSSVLSFEDRLKTLGLFSLKLNVRKNCCVLKL